MNDDRAASNGTRRHLAPGSCVRVRELGPADRPAMLTLIERLSPSDRYCRFQTLPGAEWLRKYAMDYDFSTMCAVGVFIDGQLMAMGELHLGHDERERADAGEMAFTIDPSMRRLGLGQRLAEYLKRKAAAHGVPQIFAHMLPENVPMRRVARSVGLFERRGQGSDLSARTSLA